MKNKCKVKNKYYFNIFEKIIRKSIILSNFLILRKMEIFSGFPYFFLN